MIECLQRSFLYVVEFLCKRMNATMTYIIDRDQFQYIFHIKEAVTMLITAMFMYALS